MEVGTWAVVNIYSAIGKVASRSMGLHKIDTDRDASGHIRWCVLISRVAPKNRSAEHW